MQEFWTTNRTAELGFAVAFGVLALILGTVAFGLGVGADALSENQAKSQVWNYGALVLAVGALSWAVAAGSRILPGTVIVSQAADRTIAFVLAIASVVLALVGYAQTVGYNVLDDLEGDGFFEGTFSSLDEQAWINYAIVLAFVAAGWCAVARPLTFAQGRRMAVILTAVAAVVMVLGLSIGATASDGADVLNGIVRASGWFGVAFVLVALSIGLLHGGAPVAAQDGPEIAP